MTLKWNVPDSCLLDLAKYFQFPRRRILDLFLELVKSKKNRIEGDKNNGKQ